MGCSSSKNLNPRANCSKLKNGLHDVENENKKVIDKAYDNIGGNSIKPKVESTGTLYILKNPQKIW